MKIQKKYASLLNFINIFNKFKNSDEYVDVTEEQYNVIDTAMNPLKNLVENYDYDGDGIVSLIDASIPMYVSLGVINSNDPKYDEQHKTYNGKSIDVNNDNDIDVSDAGKIMLSVKNELNQYVDISGLNNYNNSQSANDFIKSYYINHNYTFPTLQQLEAAENNNWQ